MKEIKTRTVDHTTWHLSQVINTIKLILGSTLRANTTPPVHSNEGRDSQDAVRGQKSSGQIFRSGWPWRWTEHLLALRAMLMKLSFFLCVFILLSLSPCRARHMEGRVQDCGRESNASAKQQCKSDKRSTGNLQLSSRTSTQSVYMNPLLLASKSNNSHPALTGKLLLTLSEPSLTQSPSSVGWLFLFFFFACWWSQEQFLIEAYQGGERMTLTFSILCTQHQVKRCSNFPRSPSHSYRQDLNKSENTHRHRHIHTHPLSHRTNNKNYLSISSFFFFFCRHCITVRHICLINTHIEIERLVEKNLRISEPSPIPPTNPIYLSFIFLHSLNTSN